MKEPGVDVYLLWDLILALYTGRGSLVPEHTGWCADAQKLVSFAISHASNF